jgi:hypothetical protein
MIPGSIEDFLPFSTNGVAIASDGSVWQYYPPSSTGLVEISSPATPPPVNTALPVAQLITDLNVGSQAALTTGTWTGATPFTYTRQWYRDGVDIAGAIAASYTFAAEDVGRLLSGAVTARDVNGLTATAMSAFIGPITEPPLEDPAPENLPTLRQAATLPPRSHPAPPHAKPPKRRY